jgi:hypothetical protein
MSLAGGARMAAYLAACLIVGASVLEASEPGRVRGTAWAEGLDLHKPLGQAQRLRSDADRTRKSELFHPRATCVVWPTAV